MARQFNGNSTPGVRTAGMAIHAVGLLLASTLGASALAEDGKAPGLPLETKSVPDYRALLPDPEPEALWLSPTSDDFQPGREIGFDVRESFRLNLELSDDAGEQRTDYAGTTGIWSPLDGVSLKAGIGVGQQQLGNTATPFDCMAGSTNYLDCIAGRASGRSPAASIQTYTVGASWRAFNRVELSVDYFNQSQESALGDDQVDLAISRAISRTQGLDLSLSCDIDAGSLGDLELGLQFSRVVQDGEYPAWANGNPLTDPRDEAVLGLGWERGDFRGDLTSRYMDWLGDEESESEPWTTFDINFAWRTPWNASLSVGARNVLNSPAPNAGSAIGDVQFENLLGRVPYVRYKQDL